MVPDVALTYHEKPGGGSDEEWLLLVDVAHNWPHEVVEARARCMARHRVAEYWHADPVRREVQARQHPERDWAFEPSWRFAANRSYLTGGVIQPLANQRLQVMVDDVVA